MLLTAAATIFAVYCHCYDAADDSVTYTHYAICRYVCRYDIGYCCHTHV